MQVMSETLNKVNRSVPELRILKRTSYCLKVSRIHL